MQLGEGPRRSTVTEILSHPYVTPADYTVGGLRIDSCVNGKSLTSRWKQSLSSGHHMGFGEQGFHKEEVRDASFQLLIVKRLGLISTN